MKLLYQLGSFFGPVVIVSGAALGMSFTTVLLGGILTKLGMSGQTTVTVCALNLVMAVWLTLTLFGSDTRVDSLPSFFETAGLAIAVTLTSFFVGPTILLLRLTTSISSQARYRIRKLLEGIRTP